MSQTWLRTLWIFVILTEWRWLSSYSRRVICFCFVSFCFWSWWRKSLITTTPPAPLVSVRWSSVIGGQDLKNMSHKSSQPDLLYFSLSCFRDTPQEPFSECWSRVVISPHEASKVFMTSLLRNLSYVVKEGMQFNGLISYAIEMHQGRESSKLFLYHWWNWDFELKSLAGGVVAYLFAVINQ